MEVKSAFIHANNLFGGEQNCRLESDDWHFYIFGTVSVLQVSNLEIKRCIDATKDHQGYYADLSCKNISFIISKVTTGTLLMALQEVRNHQRSTARFVVQKQRWSLQAVARVKHCNATFFCIYYKLFFTELCSEHYFKLSLCDFTLLQVQEDLKETSRVLTLL